MPVRQLRLCVTADDYDDAVRFYRDVLGLQDGSLGTRRGRRTGAPRGAEGMVERVLTRSVQERVMLTHDQVDSYREKGYLRIPQVFDAGEVEQLRGEREVAILCQPYITLLKWCSLQA